MSRAASLFECQACGHQAPKWLGRCPDCGAWNSFVEERSGGHSKAETSRVASDPVRLKDLSTDDFPRVATSDPELDRALGGGIVPGSLILLGGEPGIGKSTLLLQMAHNLDAAGRRVLYISGEESAQQIRMRAERLGGEAEEVYLLSESNLESIFRSVSALKPTDIILDSIQTAYSETLDSAPGSISQVRYVATRFLELAKNESIPVFLIGHVTKDGSIAGPKALEHIVDTVLYFEGERHHNHRIVRTVKNRFGAANELGIFEMTRRGLLPVRNPSSLFLSHMEAAPAGSAVTCALEGTRPILVEVQALVASVQYGTARRTAAGVDPNRIALLVAMLDKQLGISVAGCDIYVNATGGFEIDEPAADLAILAAVLSSFRNRAIDGKTVLLGELGLSGEVRPVSRIHTRMREASAMGYLRCVLPSGNLPLTGNVPKLELHPIKTVRDLSDLVFSG